jgi:cytochrome oxidase Cu insertion factor (SCO1/SenC/PrrC family)
VISRRRRMLLAGISAVMLLAAGALLAFAMNTWNPWPRSARPSNAIGGPFWLTAGHGRKVSEKDFLGKWLLVYFGYTHCPDICPTTLAEIAETLDRLGPLAADVQPLFITVDPERDTADVIGPYVKAFDSRIVGLSGTAAELAAAAKGYRVYYAKKEPPGKDKADYLMEHSAYVYVMRPDGRYVTLFAPLGGQGPDEMASRLRELMAAAASR